MRPRPLIEPGGPEGDNVSGANLWLHDGAPSIVYHGADGSIWIRSTDEDLTSVGEPEVLFQDPGEPRVRVASPEIVEWEGAIDLFFEYGDRLDATIARTRLADRGMGARRVESSVRTLIERNSLSKGTA